MTAATSRLLLILLFSLSSSAHAHLLKVFAWAEGDRLQGSSYFSGGAPASGASIRILDADGQLVAELTPDARGEFSYQVPARRNYRIIADTGDGHRAEWLISQKELAADPPVIESTTTETATKATVIASAGISPSRSMPGTAEPAHAAEYNELSALIEQAVARQLGPLRQELQQYEDRVRFSDTLGGIGFIFGLAGTLLWWRSRRGTDHRG